MRNNAHRTTSLIAALLVIALSCGESTPTAGLAVGVKQDIPTLPACGSEKRGEVLSTGSTDDGVVLDCSLWLDHSDYVISKFLLIQGAESSNLVLDCGHSAIIPVASKPRFGIRIASIQKEDGSWSRPANVTVQNCVVHGGIHVFGMGGKSGVDDVLFASSRMPGHTERAQAAAPTAITLFNLELVGTGTAGLYLGPGVTGVSLSHTKVTGSTGGGPGIYLDAESGGNVIDSNTIKPITGGRELIAIDGSANNRITNNWFSRLNKGGIYLYRNCGESGIVRHQRPKKNQIINNVFYYDVYDGTKPSVWLGSRQGDRNYCGDDAGVPFGSSSDNHDFAYYNVIAQNQIYKLPVSQMIRQTDILNESYDNTTVNTAVYPRPIGCYMTLGKTKYFIRDGDYGAVRNAENPLMGTRYDCDDGVTTSFAAHASLVNFSCASVSNNAGCVRTNVCPAYTKLVGLRAACHLESDILPSSVYDSLDWSSLQVADASDVVSDGLCSVSALDRSISIRQGTASMDALLGYSASFVTQCREYDQNGGDCIITGQALCL